MFNVAKSPAPAGTIDYTDFTIADSVKKDFHYKCYLCEENVAKHLEIDHFFPKSEFLEKENDWHNLFSGCSKCNKIKSTAFNTTHHNYILNCCTEDVDNAIALRYNVVDGSVAILPTREDVSSINTAELLNRIHNGHNTTSKSYIYLRESIAQQLADLRKQIDDYHIYPSEENKNRIAALISRKAAYMAIKRSLIKDYNPEFAALFD
jgi:HNH endonuclease